MLDYVSKLKSKNITLCYTDSNDYAACKCFVQFLLQNNVDCSHIGIGDYNNLDGFLSFLSSQESIVSPRMHACILGLKYSLDTFPILISPKMRAFASKYINNRTNVDNNRTLILDAINRIAACR
jgi:polysaccharide pyruvyl transferase WcaK-like protein